MADVCILISKIQLQKVYWHKTGDVVTFGVAGDAGQFRIPAVTNVPCVSVRLLFRVKAVFVAEVTLPAAAASAVDSRYCCCSEHIGDLLPAFLGRPTGMSEGLNKRCWPIFLSDR